MMPIDDRMSWKCHIEHIGSKLSMVCCIIRSIKPYMSINTLKMVYHSILVQLLTMVYHFEVTPPQSLKIFRMQKNIIRIMLVRRRRDSCRILIRELEILALASQYIYFQAKNKMRGS
jgi:hypothetical protein